MSTNLEPVDLRDGKFEEDNYYLALLKDDYVIAILEDQQPTANEQKNLISIVGGELVWLHGLVTFVLITELRKTRYSPEMALDSAHLLKKPNIFGRDQPTELNKPMKVKFGPGIVQKWTQNQVTTAVFIDRRGYPADISQKLSTQEQIFLAKQSRATHLLGIFDIQHELTGMASIHRSSSK